MRTAARRPFALRGFHVLMMLLAFFGAVIAINVAFAVAAARSFPGEDVPRSYLQGLNYNETLAERRVEAARGWRAGVEADWRAQEIIVRIVDAEGRGLAGLTIEGALRRPLDARHDAQLSFTDRGGGDYRATIANGAPGAWELRAKARRGGERFTFSRRLMWPSSTPS
jgi:nitrogen fixation protein FixH